MDVPEKEMISGTAWTRLYYYVVPARVSGTWELSLPKTLAAFPLTLRITQEPDVLNGSARDGNADTPLRDLTVAGARIRFGLLHKGTLMALEGNVAGETMTGEASARGVRGQWTARYRGSLAR